jgi:hypothetical protein
MGRSPLARTCIPWFKFAGTLLRMASDSPVDHRTSLRAFSALILATVGAAAMFYYIFQNFMPRVESVKADKHLFGEYFFGGDIYPIWLTSREWLVHHRDPYSPEVTREIQIGLFGRQVNGEFPTDPPSGYRTFAYPAFTDLLFWPISEVPFRTLRFAWVALLAAFLAATLVCWARAMNWRLSWPWLTIAILLTTCSYPELEGLYAGQLGLLVGFALAAAILALIRKQFMIAGILLALTMIKPQMTLLALLYLFFWCAQQWRQRYKFIVAFLGTVMLLTAASLAVWPGWVGEWLGVLRGYPGYSTPPLAAELLGFESASYGGRAVILALLAYAVLVAWRGRKVESSSYEFWITLSLLLAITSLTLLPGQSVCDHVILLPGIFLLARYRGRDSSRVFRTLIGIGTAVLLWPYVSAFGLIVLRPVLRPEIFSSKAVFVLPLRTAASFPAVVLGLLVLAARPVLGTERLVRI